MSILTYHVSVLQKPLVWLQGEIKTPPFSLSARIEVGMLLRRLQRGESLSMPGSRPMPAIGRNCHELRVTDKNRNWRIVYRIYPDAIVIGEIFAKTSQQTPISVIDNCRRRFTQYDRDLK
jgi:phage-related protein